MSTTKILSTEQIAMLSGDKNKGVSICIPRVFANISWYRIKQSFIALNWGFIERVDVIPSGGTKRAFVHFAPGRFNNVSVLQSLCNGESIKIIYDDPWYWNISLSKSPKPSQVPNRQSKPKVEINGLGSGKAKDAHSGRKLVIDVTENCPIPENDTLQSQIDDAEAFLTCNY